MRAVLVLPLALLAAPALASTDVVEIRLGTPPPPPPRVEPAKIHAVEGFLSARQAGSSDRRREEEARVYFAKGIKVSDVTLFGPKGLRLAAFDFHDRAIQTLGSNRFEISVYLLFADEDGRVRESRDETLVFTRSGAAHRVTSLRATNEMVWAEAAVSEGAASAGVAEELAMAETHLREWSKARRPSHAYSVADAFRAEDGGVVVECIRFTSNPGKRGYEVLDEPLHVRRVSGELRVESN